MTGFPQTCQNIPRPSILDFKGLFSPVFGQPCILPWVAARPGLKLTAKWQFTAYLNEPLQLSDPFQSQLITAEG